MRVYLVPGHGGKDPGCIGPTGLQEKAVALQIAERAERLLVSAGFTVGMSRTGDNYVSPNDQRRFANFAEPDVVVALHLNAAQSRSARGFEVWTTRGTTRSDALATEMFAALGAHLVGEPGRKDLSDGDPDKESNFAILMCKAPAILIEFGFLSNPETEAKFRESNTIDDCAWAVADGLDRWRKRITKEST